MKKNTVALIVLMFILAIPSGCIKDDGGNSLLPDVTNFSIEAVDAWTAGAATTVTFFSSSLGPGQFTINYDLAGANNMPGISAVINMSGNRASFKTPVLPNAGETQLTVRSVSNSSGSSALTSNNTYTFSDSTGLMNATMAGNPYRATHVDANWAGSGSILAIHAIKWMPLTTVTLYIDNWSGLPATVNFNAHNSTSFLGSAAYSSPGQSHLSEHGTITVAAVSPLITGSFSFTSEDSSIVSGTFSCPHP